MADEEMRDQAVVEPEPLPPQAEISGQLLIIGGAEDKEGDRTILREFVRRAGGLQARITVMTVATGLPGEVGEQYLSIFENLGVADVRVVDTARREDASDPRAIEAIEQATGVFFTGGNQARITECLKDTELDAMLHQRYVQGLVIAGTSAGAAMMPEMMIVEGEGETNPRMEVAKMDRGMGFLPGVVIDQHFAQRGRLGRLVSAVVQQPVVLGFGIDENTAIAVSGNEVEVIGEGAITVIDVANLQHTNIHETLRDESIALCGAKLHILPHGYKFDLAKRLPTAKPLGCEASTKDTGRRAGILPATQARLCATGIYRCSTDSVSCIPSSSQKRVTDLKAPLSSGI